VVRLPNHRIKLNCQVVLDPPISIGEYPVFQSPTIRFLCISALKTGREDMKRFPKIPQTLSPAVRRAVMLATVLLFITASLVSAALGDTIRVSVASSGIEGNDDSSDTEVSADGRYVAFESDADNLVAGDTNGTQDVFVRDRTTGTTTRASVATGGAEGNGYSDSPALSAEGRFVAFESIADNLVPAGGDTNGNADVFVHDRTTGTTTRVSVDSAENEAVGGHSDDSVISADGRYVAFTSDATNLVAGDTNNWGDIFVRDRTTGTTTRVSVDSSGVEAVGGSSVDPAISGNGRYVAFESRATNLVAGDTNDRRDVFVHDRTTGKTTRVSVDSTGTQADESSYKPAISYDGRIVAFDTDATNLVAGDTNGDYDVFVHDRMTGITTRVSITSAGLEAIGGSSEDPAISGNGLYVAFESRATNLVPAGGDANGEDDIFVHDRTTGKTIRVTVDSAGREANDESDDPAFSADGRYVAFESEATNLVAGDTNGEDDVFLHEFSKLPDLQATKTNDTGGVGSVGVAFNWTVTVFNTGNGDAAFTNGQTILWDDLPAGTTYGAVVVNNDNTTGAGTVECAIAGNTLACTARDGTVIIGANTGKFDVVFEVTPAAEGELINPDAAGVCQVDHNNNLYEDDETNNNCTNTVNIGVPNFDPVCVDLGSMGGIFAIHGGAVVTIPPGAAPDGSSLCWDHFAHPGADSSGTYPLSFAVDIRLIAPDNTQLTSFNPPLELCLPITDEQITKAGSADNLRLAWRQSMDDGKPWTLMATLVKNVTGYGQMACAPTNHLTIFTLFGPLAQNLPQTGFAPNMVTKVGEPATDYFEFEPHVGAQQITPDAYFLNGFAAPQQGMILEIPRIGVTTPIIGVPETTAGWDVSWLGDSAGWLEGTAYPTWEGNTALTGHVYNADGAPGVFAKLHTLWWGDRVVIRSWGQEHVYAVRSVQMIGAGDRSHVQHDDLDWLTLITCRGYDEDTGEYRWRTVVRAARIQ
jgi:LPXTG-site transpeptidase (sortase) family protein